MDPINYSVDVQTPFQSAVQGYQAGAAMRNDQFQAQQQQAALAQQQKQQQIMQALMANPNPTAQDYANATLAVPVLHEQIKQSWAMRNQAQQQGDLDHVGQVFAALNASKPDIATKVIQDRADALRNSGDEKGAKTAEAIIGTIKENPSVALKMIGLKLAAIPGGDKVFESVAKIGSEARADQLQPGLVKKGAADADAAVADATTKSVTAEFARPNAQADIEQKAAQLGLTKSEVRNINSQIGNRAATLGLDRQKFQLETDKFLFEKSQKLQDIGQDGRKLVNDAAVTAGAAKLSADRANDLAGRVTDIGESWGAAGSFAEWYAKQTGRQDAVSELRSQYTQLRNTEGVKNLPPGPASDNDVKMALDGIPPPTANPKVMQSWLRGVAKLNDISAAVENARADYAASNKGLLGRARTSFQAGGTDVVAGDSWVQISKRVAEAAARKYTPEKERVKPASGAELIPGSGMPGARVQDAQRAGAAPKVIDFASLPDR